MTETDLVDLLESRGLVISDEAKAIRYLERAYSIGLPPLHKKKAIMTTNKKMSIEDYCTDNGGTKMTALTPQRYGTCSHCYNSWHSKIRLSFLL